MAYKYNPKRISLVIHGFPIRAFAKGTFVTVDRDNDAAEKSIGNDGRATVILNPNEGCSISFIIQQSSPENEFLSARVPSAARNSLPVGDVQLMDLNGASLVHS